ncbi:MAG TPA: TVP38/TMEM64 family protein [Chthoniobacteraceae bacterium]|jgi:uncharacterized membrane protein YdjX (TVP38/TMEM64 family)|nr:TVP38/TMEM64 family protein [Chthoniobacteraceae bacterium]
MTANPNPRRTGGARRAAISSWLFQICGFAVALGVVALLAHHYDLVHVLDRMQRRMGGMQWYGALIYPLFVAACNLLLLPGSVLTLGSGLFFGLWWGSFLVLCGNVLGAAVAFGIGRLLGRTWVEERILRREKWARLDQAISREGWKIIFLSQVHPLFPTSLLNYFYGITRIRFRTCLLWIALAQFPGIFLYAYLGTLAQLGLKMFGRKTPPHPYEYFIWFGGLLLTALVTAAIGRIALRLLAEAGALPEEKREPQAGKRQLEEPAAKS